MKRKLFSELSLSLKNKLFSFAYVLVADDLQATQIVVDALTRLLVKNKDYWLELDEVFLKDKKQEIHLKRELFLDLLSCVFEIGSRRAHQLTHQHHRDNFFKTLADPKARAVAFLKFKWKLTNHEIEKCLKLNKVEVIEQTFQVRYQLSKTQNENNLLSQPDYR